MENYTSVCFFAHRYICSEKTCSRFYLFCLLILVSIGIWPWEGRNTFLPFGDWCRYAPVTAAIGHEPSSLRSSRDGRRVPMTFSDTSNHTANQRSIGEMIIETRFYRICITKLPIMWWSPFLIIQSKQKNNFYFFYK